MYVCECVGGGGGGGGEGGGKLKLDLRDPSPRSQLPQW